MFLSFSFSYTYGSCIKNLIEGSKISQVFFFKVLIFVQPCQPSLGEKVEQRKRVKTVKRVLPKIKWVWPGPMKAWTSSCGVNLQNLLIFAKKFQPYCTSVSWEPPSLKIFHHNWGAGCLFSGALDIETNPAMFLQHKCVHSIFASV